MKKLSVELSNDIHSELKAISALKQKSISKYVVEILNKELKRDAKIKLIPLKIREVKK